MAICKLCSSKLSSKTSLSIDTFDDGKTEICKDCARSVMDAYTLKLLGDQCALKEIYDAMSPEQKDCLHYIVGKSING